MPDPESYRIRGGAKRMIDVSILENPKVDAAFAFHVWPEFEYGIIGLKDGILTATSDIFRVNITGKGGHVAKPKSTNNPVLAVCDAIMQIKLIENSEPHILDIVDVDVKADAKNIIPTSGIFWGSIRTLSLETRDLLEGEILKILEETKERHKVEYEIDFIHLDYLPVINDLNNTKHCENSASKVAIVRRLINPYFIGEDFGWFSSSGIPSTLMLLGCSPIDRIGNNELHTDNMIVDERTLQLGIDIMTDVALSYNLETNINITSGTKYEITDEAMQNTPSNTCNNSQAGDLELQEYMDIDY